MKTFVIGTKYISKLLLQVFVASIIIFIIARSLPISPMEMLLTTFHLPHTEENINMLAQKWGLNQPIILQYFSWLKNFFLGNWGTSLISGNNIRVDLLQRLPCSLLISMGGLLLAIVLSFFLGFLAAIKKGFWDFLSRFIILSSQVIPPFIFALLIIYIFSIKYTFFHFYTDDKTPALAWGILIFSGTCLGQLVRVVRTHFLDLSKEAYIVRLHTVGFSETYIMLRHGYKPVLHQLCGVLVSKFAVVFGGAAVIEYAFALPGISYYLIDTITHRDYMAIQSYLMILVIWMVLIHILFDFIQHFLGRGVNP